MNETQRKSLEQAMADCKKEKEKLCISWRDGEIAMIRRKKITACDDKEVMDILEDAEEWGYSDVEIELTDLFNIVECEKLYKPFSAETSHKQTPS
jgi:hypothetical protein